MSKIGRLRQRAALLREEAQRPTKVVARLSGPRPLPQPTPPPPKESKIERKRRINEQLDYPVQYEEIRRIVGLPLITPMDPPEFEDFNRRHVLAQPYESGWRLFQVQAEAVRAWGTFGGLFGAIGCGWGKSLITFMVADKAYRAGYKRMVLFVPPSVIIQTVKAALPWARTKVPVSCPVHVLHGGMNVKGRRALAVSGKKGLYIIPYSLMSTKDARDLLNGIRPELIIADEADALGNPRAGRTKRVKDYVQDHKPKFCALSGTITDKSITDYIHLIRWCLGDYSPLPLSAHLASEWATLIDSKSQASSATGPIRPLLAWAAQNFPEEEISEDVRGFRTAYKLRLRTCPGVAATSDAEIGPSLILHNEPAAQEPNEQLTSLISKVTDEWLTPNGDEIDHAIHTFKWLYELSAGFYNELTWPSTDVFAEREGISEDAAESCLERARDYHGAHQIYSSELRRWLEECARPHLDTPFLVGGDMARHGPKNVGEALYDLWAETKEREELLSQELLRTGAHKGSQQELAKKLAAHLRDSRTVRVCDYKVQAVVDWAWRAKKRKEGGLVWVYHKGMGEWVTDALTEAGLDPIYCPSGNAANAVLDPNNADKIAKRIVVASLSAHGRGKELQHAFSQQLYLQWPRNAKLAEQSLGRLHRNGQKESEVWTFTVTTTEFDQMCFAACLNDALYIHQSTGSRQKLIYANYSPRLPKIFPAAVLLERGFQNRKLTAEQEKLMQERFKEES